LAINKKQNNKRNIMYKIKMNFILVKLLLVLFVTFSMVTGITAQWQPNLRLTFDGAVSNTSSGNAWSTAVNGTTVHAVWYDSRDGYTEIYYKRSTNGGTNWGVDTRLTNAAQLSESPSISVSGQVVIVAWWDSRSGDDEIYCKRSTDEGISWSTDSRLTNTAGFSWYPSVSLSGMDARLVWQDDRNGNYEIYYKRSTDGGISWGADTRLTNNSFVSAYPSIAVNGNILHAVWYDNRDGNFEIYCKRSTDGGLNWGADTRLTNNSSASVFPSVSASGTLVNIVWSDNRDGNYEIYCKRSTDDGLNWGTDTRITGNSAFSENPSVSVSGQTVHIVWDDNRDGNYEIYFNRSTDGGVNWSADTRLTNNAGDSKYPSVSVSGSLVNVVWCDNTENNWEIYCKRDPAGNPVGITNTNSDIPKVFSLSQNYPNPFNPTTKISFSIADFGSVSVKVFDITGKEVAVLVNEELNPGRYNANFDAGNFGSGVYFYKIDAGKFIQTKKMILIK
jgi:hypothetical protein